MPIPSDMPRLVDDMAKPALWFSGAMCLVFVNEPEGFLTWVPRSKSESGGYSLASVPESTYAPHALDRINIYSDLPWLPLIDATLRRVSLFSVSTDSHSKIGA